MRIPMFSLIILRIDSIFSTMELFPSGFLSNDLLNYDFRASYIFLTVSLCPSSLIIVAPITKIHFNLPTVFPLRKL